MHASTLLSIENLSMHFGGIVALDSVSFTVEPEQICGLIGPNGAGKTTVFNCLSRLFSPARGRILLKGREITRMAPDKIAEAGIGRTFQNLAMFNSMSVLDNVLVGTHCNAHTGFLSNIFRTRPVKAEASRARSKAMELLEFVRLADVANQRVSELPFGSQKRVELARALASEPKLLLLDEPAAGLNHEEVSALDALIRSIRDQLRISVLLVEHHMGLVMGISDKVVALNFGRQIAEGAPEQVQSNPEVIRAYLGGQT